MDNGEFIFPFPFTIIALIEYCVLLLSRCIEGKTRLMSSLIAYLYGLIVFSWIVIFGMMVREEHY
jgi:hypothetical protein